MSDAPAYRHDRDDMRRRRDRRGAPPHDLGAVPPAPSYGLAFNARLVERPLRVGDKVKIGNSTGLPATVLGVLSESVTIEWVCEGRRHVGAFRHDQVVRV